VNKPASIATPTEQRDGPSLFIGIGLEVQEIILCRNKLDGPCAQLRAAMADRHEASLKQAADEIAVIAGQMQTLSAHLASVISRHQVRNPQFPK
jgi:hypothetical protein